MPIGRPLKAAAAAASCQSIQSAGRPTVASWARARASSSRGSSRRKPSSRPATRPCASAGAASRAVRSAAARNQRACRLSGALKMPCISPPGLPEVSAAGVAWRSITSTCQPWRSRPCAAAAPARPAPITSAWRGPACGGRHAAGRGGTKRGACRATVMSRLPPKPGARSTAKPIEASPSRTARAALQVAAVAPGATRRASRRNSSALHSSALRAGAKPSR